MRLPEEIGVVTTLSIVAIAIMVADYISYGGDPQLLENWRSITISGLIAIAATYFAVRVGVRESKKLREQLGLKDNDQVEWDQ